jgi:hypothetical protein
MAINRQVVSPHEQLDRRPAIDAVIHAFQPVVEPAQLDAVELVVRLGAEVDLADLPRPRDMDIICDIRVDACADTLATKDQGWKECQSWTFGWYPSQWTKFRLSPTTMHAEIARAWNTIFGPLKSDMGPKRQFAPNKVLVPCC